MFDADKVLPGGSGCWDRESDSSQIVGGEGKPSGGIVYRRHFEDLEPSGARSSSFVVCGVNCAKVNVQILDILHMSKCSGQMIPD